MKRLARMVNGSRQKCREDPVSARNQGSPANRNRNCNQRKVSANTASGSKVHRADSKESKIHNSKQDQRRIERNQNGGTRRKRNHTERNNNRSDSIDTRKKPIHRRLLSRIRPKRKTKKAIPRKATRQRDDQKQDKEACGNQKDFVSSQVELTQKLFQQKNDDVRRDPMETENLQSSGSSFDADWSYKVDSTAATNRGKNSDIDNSNSNSNTQRSQSKGSQPAYITNKSPRANRNSRKPDQDKPRDSRRPSKNKSTAKKARRSRKNELDSTLRELFHLIGKKNKYSSNINDPSMNNRNGSNRNQGQRRHSNEKQTRSRSLKRNDRTAIRSKSKNPRSKSLPPNQQSKRTKSPHRTLPSDKSSDKRAKTAPTKRNADLSLPLKNHCEHKASKNQPIEEPSETSQTDRTARTEYTTSSAGPVDQSSFHQRARSRSKSRRSASRTRSSSRRPKTNRARSTSRKPRSTNSKMSVEDAKKLLYPTNHPTYVIQPVIDSSSEDEDDERERRTERRTRSQPSPRRRRPQKRETAKDRGFSGLGVQQSKPRKGRRPKRTSEESKTERRESPPSSPVITLSTRSSRRIQRSHSRERQRKEKHLSPEVFKIEGTKYLSDALNKYPNPFVKTT